MKIKMLFKSGVTIDFVAKSIRYNYNNAGDIISLSWDECDNGLNMSYLKLNDVSAIFFEKESNNE